MQCEGGEAGGEYNDDVNDNFDMDDEGGGKIMDRKERGNNYEMVGNDNDHYDKFGDKNAIVEGMCKKHQGLGRGGIQTRPNQTRPDLT